MSATMIIRTADLGPPADYEETSTDLANFDHEIPPGLDAELRAGKVWSRYAGWDFNGRIWLDAEGSFSCQVWVRGRPVATVRANSLEEIMTAVSNEWGWD